MVEVAVLVVLTVMEVIAVMASVVTCDGDGCWFMINVSETRRMEVECHSVVVVALVVTRDDDTCWFPISLYET